MRALVVAVAAAVVLPACVSPPPATPRAATSTSLASLTVTERWLAPSEVVPHGTAPGARHTLLASRDDGTKDWALVLTTGDEVGSALAAFAKAENVGSGRFTAIGAVHDPEVGFFDLAQNKYRAMHLAEQGEVLSLVGDIGIGANGEPAVHAHLVFGRRDGSTFGGHLVSAVVAPTLEVFLTTYPARLPKKRDPATDLQMFELPPP